MAMMIVILIVIARNTKGAVNYAMNLIITSLFPFFTKFCRTVFEDTFRRMYALPSHAEALPPMPEDGGRWSVLHSWVMPTPSFLEFIMFSRYDFCIENLSFLNAWDLIYLSHKLLDRMFADSLNGLHGNSGNATTCLLGSSNLEVSLVIRRAFFAFKFWVEDVWY